MVEFVETVYTVDEGDGAVDVCVRISGAAPSGPIVVRLIATQETAEGTQVYTYTTPYTVLYVFDNFLIYTQRALTTFPGFRTSSPSSLPETLLCAPVL